MTFNGQTQEEMLRQLLTTKREGELVNPHMSIQKAVVEIDYANISQRIGGKPQSIVANSEPRVK